jgi:hypothetical protein
VSFLYPRTASFHRPAGQTGIGAVGYGGQTVAAETPISGAQGVRCSIQERREGAQTSMLPGDGYKPTWYVFIPKAALAKGTLLDRDAMIDDAGLRYQVIAAYWDSLGYRLTVASLEA